MATHSSILAWRILWTEEPGRLWSIGSQKVRHACTQKNKNKNNSWKSFLFQDKSIHQDQRIHGCFDECTFGCVYGCVGETAGREN